MNFNLILAIGASATLAIPQGYVVGNAALVFCGLLRWKGLNPLLRDSGDFRWFLLACLAFVVVNGTLLAYHGEPAGAYEYLVPFLITPFMLNALRGRPLNPNFLFAGFALAALAAGLLAANQVWISGTHLRAVGHIRKAIPFGNLSILAGTVSLVGLIYNEKGSPFYLRILFVFGFLFGLFASLLSGSKGGWLAVMVAGPFSIYLVSRTLTKRTIAIVSCMLVAGVGFAIFCPRSPVLNRISQTVATVSQGNLTRAGADGSLSPRLSMWGYVLQHGMRQSPWVGASRAELRERQRKAIEEGSAPGLRRAWVHFHNEFLDTLATKGVAGAAVLLLLLFSAFQFFVRRVHNAIAGQRVLGWLGVIVLLEFVVFSLTDIQFQLNAVRNVFVFFVVSLASLILAGEQGSLSSLDSSDRPTNAP